MCDMNLNSDVPSALVNRMADFVLDGVVLVDDQMKIRLASASIESEFKLNSENKLSGKDYFETMFGLNGADPAQRAQIKQTPLAKAMAMGKVEKDSPPYPTVKARNGIAYQIETRVAECSGGAKIALEFWRRMGLWEVFKNDPSALSLDVED